MFYGEGMSGECGWNCGGEGGDVFRGDLGLRDLDGGRFYHAERTNRAGPDIAAVNESLGRIWNGNWQIQWHGRDQELKAIDERFQLHLTLHPEKLPIIHGENGVSQKAEGPGRASHYISLTLVATSGVIDLGTQKIEVSGTSWMDHEFFTHQFEPEQIGWDSLSLQLIDHT